MKIKSIVARKDKIELLVDGCDGKALTVNARVPLVCGKEDPDFVPGRVVASYTVSVMRGKAEISRYADGYDLLLCRFEVFAPEKLEGVCYVTEFDPEASASHEPYPDLPVKAINSGALMEDFEELGFSQTCFGPNQAEIGRAHV